tara:strand:+ start:144 stop:407 length:264 start_codon:yes stop_codon:yes gene_type:complete
MNKLGQNLMTTIVVGILIFMVGALFINYLTPEITLARNADNLDCANTAISDGAKLTCLVVDAVVPYYILSFVAVAGAIIAGRFMFAQ